jgi:hypothetical protein
MTPLFAPVLKVESYLRELGAKEVFICVYSHTPRSRKYDQEIIPCSVDRLIETYQKLESKLTPGHEIAIHSRCLLEDGTTIRHLPMLDWRGRDMPSISKLREIASVIRADEFALFDSGRSFHVYFRVLLSEPDFLRFLTEAVLVENRQSTSGVDYRWAAHRLIDGFATLRWSATTRRHAHEPHLMIVGKVRRLVTTGKTSGSRTKNSAAKTNRKRNRGKS